MKHKISAVIITFNEERNIERCLRSLEGIADEIVVLDSFSADDTEMICSTFNVNFISSEWLGYSASKNLANSHTSHDYILSMDADEAISPELKRSILKVKEEGLDQAYEFNRLSFYCGKWIKHGDWYPDRKMRLWNKNEGQWEGDIHEKVRLKNGVQKIHLKGDLYHYSFYSMEEHHRQLEKYAKMSAEDLYKKGKGSPLHKRMISPAFQFFSSYFLKAGFLDGSAGFRVARMTALGTYKKYAFLKELNKG